MRKFYCYIDESGIETNGRLFIVACVVIDDDPQLSMSLCEQLETESGKGIKKWGKTLHSIRVAYMRRVMKAPALRGRLCYAVFRTRKDYEVATIEAIVRAVRQFATQGDYRVSVYIDALSKTKRRVYGARLRQAGIAVHNLQGVDREEHNALIRLADAVAGLVRDGIDKEGDEVVALFEYGEASGALIEV